MVGHGNAGFGCVLSTNDKLFILKALQEEHRIDGRRPLDFRTPQIKISLDGETVTLNLGKTMVTTTITATITSPNAGRANEGIVQLFVENGGMASDFGSRTGEEATSEVQAMLDKAIRNIKAVDPETLCIVTGRQVWKIRASIKILDAAGIVTDAVFLCCLTALMAFKRPDVTVEAGEDGSHPLITVHPVEEREAVPLTLHQAPLAISFALFQDGDQLVVDPSSKEEAASSATVTVVMNAHNEVLLLHKSGGLGVSLSQIMYIVRVAQSKVGMLHEKVKAALEAHETARVAARVRRQQPGSQMDGRASRFLASQPAVDISSVEVLSQAVGVELEALELAVAELPSSSEDDEDMDKGQDRAKLSEGPDGRESLQEQPVGIGVRAPPPNAAEEGLISNKAVGRDSRESIRLLHGGAAEPITAEQEVKPKTYEEMANIIAGPQAEAQGGLEGAIMHRKRKKGDNASKKQAVNS